jgi:hypothetical protein
MKFIPSMLLAALCLNSMPLVAQRLPNTLLWRITGKNGHHTSYDSPAASPGHPNGRYARINKEIADKIRLLEDSSK